MQTSIMTHTSAIRGFSNTYMGVKNKIVLFAIITALLTIFGGLYIQSAYLTQSIHFSRKDSLEAKLTITSAKIPVTNNPRDQQKLYTTTLTVHLKNNSSDALTGIKLVFPSVGLGTLETTTAQRFPFLSQKASESVFTMPNIPSEATASASIMVYAEKRGTYIFRANIENNEKVRAATNIITISAE